MKKHGGNREGSGRKSNASKMLEAGFVAKWMTTEFQEIKWRQLVNSADESVSLKAMMYLSDRIYGKPQQAIEHTGKDGNDLTVRIVHVGVGA